MNTPEEVKVETESMLNDKNTDVINNADQQKECCESNCILEIDTTDESVTADKCKQIAERHTIKELRDLCRNKGLNIQGKKIELAERYLKHDLSKEDIIMCS